MCIPANGECVGHSAHDKSDASAQAREAKCEFRPPQFLAMLKAISEITKDTLNLEDIQNVARVLKEVLSQVGTLEVDYPKLAYALEPIVEYAENYTQDKAQLETAARVVGDFVILVERQMERITKDPEGSNPGWRIELISAAGRFVDRQVSWSQQMGSSLPADDTKTEDTGVSSPVLLIPSYIGYTARADNTVTPQQGLEASAILTITEKGKRIVDNIIIMNDLSMDAGNDRLFSLSDRLVQCATVVGGTFCAKQNDFGKIIDALYMVFYENLEHFKRLEGKGDKDEGDNIVRNSRLYECIFDIKTLRTDLRHDVNHGKQKDVRGKLAHIADCYEQYCGRRPVKPRDYRILQERLYDKVLELEDHLIDTLLSGDH